MPEQTTIDMSGLGSLLKGIHNALIGTGQKGDLRELVSDETRRLSMEIARPSSAQVKKTERSVKSDIGKVFMAMPAKPFTGKKRHGEKAEWLMAGPNFLLGAIKEQIVPSASKSLFYRATGKLPKDKTRDVGKRGQQHVILVNRLLTGKARIKALFNEIKKRIGIREASFAETAKELKEGKIPSANKKHFPTGKNITRLHKLGGENPEVLFGSNAHGVSLLKDKVKKAVSVREHKMAHRLKLILSGYAKDNNSGHQIKHHAKEGAHD